MAEYGVEKADFDELFDRPITSASTPP